jgi:2-polyprenyl-6-methoxyphenol hydroxylase-like FAD-dependent oxidoreductase
VKEETTSTRDHAIVIGGSMAGLLTARVLANHFARVTLIERDPFGDGPESRKGQPQTRHLHGLLAQGADIMVGYFPGLLDDLRAAGAFVGDAAASMRWFVNGGYRTRFPSHLTGATMTRPFLEWLIRSRVAALPNLTLRHGHGVAELVATQDRRRVTGVRLTGSDNHPGDVLSAELVVDAAGRGSAAPRWLKALGYDEPEETVLRVDVGYATRIFRRDPNAPGAWEWIFVTPVAPRERRIGGAFPVEGHRWILTLGGWFGDHPPTDEAGFRGYARELPAPDIYQIASTCEPLSDIVSYKFAASIRRHYERMTRFPEGYLVLGDAACSFNPVYGQGMTSAAMQAAALDQLLARRGAGWSEGLAPEFFQRVAKVVDPPWQLAVGEDFRFPEAVGKRPPGTNLINSYVSQVHKATHRDPTVGLAFLEVMNLLKPPATLMRPSIVARVLKDRLVH